MAMSVAELIEPIRAEGGETHLPAISDWGQGRTLYGGASALIAYVAAIRAFADLPPLRAAQIAFVSPVNETVDLRREVVRQGRNVTQVRSEIWSGHRRKVASAVGLWAKRVDEAKKSLFEWQGVIGTMAFKKDANIPMEDRHGIFMYLGYLHGTKGSTQAGKAVSVQPAQVTSVALETATFQASISVSSAVTSHSTRAARATRMPTGWTISPFHVGGSTSGASKPSKSSAVMRSAP